MAEPRKSTSNYRSGTDYTMEFGKFRFRFSARDFRERCEFAAVQLAFVPQQGCLEAAEVEQLVELVAHGEISSEGGLQDHIQAHRQDLLGFDDDLVHWLRKLVFRGAWVDQQIKDDLAEPVFEDGTFTYRCAVTNDPIEDIADKPDWSRVAYRMERR